MPLKLALIVLLLVSTSIVAKEKVKLTADHIRYNETTHELVASTNAVLKHNEIEISAGKLILNTKTNILRGEGKIHIERDELTMDAKEFSLDLGKNRLSVNGVVMVFSPFSSTHNIYIRADTLRDEGTYKSGDHGLITTCEYDPPHYFMKAEHFLYHPNERIIGQNVTFYNPLMGLPLGFWSPAYIYEIGKRQVVYLMPAIGANRVEGNFFKSTFDYYFGPDRFGHVYVDIMSNQGLGVGVKHNYQLGDQVEGKLYLYSVTPRSDIIQEWEQSTKLSPTLAFTHHLKTQDIYQLSGGRSAQTLQAYGLHQDDLGDEHKLSYSQSKREVQNSKSQSTAIRYERMYNQKREWDLSFNQFQATRTRETFRLSENHTLPNEFVLRNTIHLQRNETVAGGPFDEVMRTTTIITKDIEGWGSTKTEVSLFFDPDMDRVTQDVNTYVKKLPEFTFTAIPLKWGIVTFQETMIIGDYEEAFFVPQLNTIRIFRNSRYLFKQHATTRFTKLPLNGSLSLRAGYDQYIYATNDQIFSLNWQANYQTDSGKFLQTNTVYQRVQVPDEGNSPFFFDDKNQLNVNRVTEALTFYYDSPSKYRWGISSGYDWVLEQQLDYKTDLNIAPNPEYRLNVRTGFRIRRNLYDPLTGTLYYKPNKSFQFGAQFNHDLNKGVLVNLINTISGVIGSRWQDRWIFSARFIYQPINDTNYQLQTLSITKDLHRRKLTFTYDRLLEEYRVTFKIDAFPSDSLGLSTNKNSTLELEGVFDDESVKRF